MTWAPDDQMDTAGNTLESEPPGRAAVFFPRCARLRGYPGPKHEMVAHQDDDLRWLTSLVPRCFVFDLEQMNTNCNINRRKFRSETSDNMDSWKAEVRRVRRERVRRKKTQMREKVGKSRNTVFFQWFGAPEGGKVGSLKRRVRSQLARWEMKKCTPLWREAHLQVKM